MSSANPWGDRRIHFVGVGGAGMSGYARAAHALGASVTGSDRAETPYLARLREEGVLDAAIGHDVANLPAGAGVEVVHSSAVSAENPERAAARERGLPDRPRAELLGELSALRRTVAVAGAHGKTTTSAMIVHILRGEGLDPGWLIGSSIGDGLANSHWSEGEWLVIEADESDRSMLSLHVEVAVLTNVELDHHARFRSLAELREAFAEFLLRASGAIVVWDRPDLLALTAKAAAKLIAYNDPRLLEGTEGTRFAWHEQEVALAVPGAHNALNATAALEAAVLAGSDERRAPAWLAGFTGAGRRFQRVGLTTVGATVIDDYAHHPTEVAATLQAARTQLPKRLVAVFQPHLYSRTAILAREFGAALSRADAIVVLDVYPARERAEDFPGVSGLTIARAVTERAHGREVLWLPDFANARGVLAGLLREGDLCVVMGAGNVDVLARELVA
ncbi:MAG TPA: UDP-N-acetylmuramate--L-alanine ligase [Solirubrobacteraceae bacterium]|nr:UDP-N-acetylmuramate--L-alanine ligase [Solirubrobacteraceae bacterium]